MFWTNTIKKNFLPIFQKYLVICCLWLFLSITSFGLLGSDTNISFCFLWDDTAVCLDGCKNLFYLISPSSWIIEAYSKNLSNSRVDRLKIVGHLVQQFFLLFCNDLYFCLLCLYFSSKSFPNKYLNIAPK